MALHCSFYCTDYNNENIKEKIRIKSEMVSPFVHFIWCGSTRFTSLTKSKCHSADSQSVHDKYNIAYYDCIHDYRNRILKSHPTNPTCVGYVQQYNWLRTSVYVLRFFFHHFVKITFSKIQFQCGGFIYAVALLLHLNLSTFHVNYVFFSKF